MAPSPVAALRAGADGPEPPPVRLGELASAVCARHRVGDAWVWGLSSDSRQVRPGDLFFAMPGARTDGHEHAGQALAAGATALVVERPLDLDVPQLVVPSLRAAVGPLAAAYYRRPADRMSMVGVTGTNGKTTVCTLLRHCLDHSAAPAGQLGTLGGHFLGRVVPGTLTTPDAPVLQRTLWRMAEAGVAAVAMEASSHGLDQGRLDGIAFEVGIFTNLSREHLDYHRTMERYWEAKVGLFRSGRCRCAVVGVDDQWGWRTARPIDVPVVTFGGHPRADVRVMTTERGLDGITVDLAGPDGDVRVTSPLVGAVNGANVAAAYLAARQLGVASAEAAAGIAAAPPPPGRFELVDAGQPFLVVVDYAHTPDALAALIQTGRRLAPGRTTVVVGARGNRDKGKRPITGRVAASADRVVLTNDSPGDEPPAQIIEALFCGTLDADRRASVVIEPDRRRAIETAVAASAPGDIVLIVGRGHEQAQHFGAETVPFDDRVAAYGALTGSTHRCV